MRPFLLQPCCKDYIWGGIRLREFGKNSDADRIAESWELSTHPDGESVIASGEFEGMTLTQFLNEHPSAAGLYTMMHSKPLPIVKLIDAHENLSVQVHPDKTEMWYVVDAEPGASILYGFREEITKEQFRVSIENGTLLDYMQEIPVKPGDVFMIPSGTLHAIGKGILIAEVQEYSNTTYRVFDYNRGRELHVEQALEITTLLPAQNREISPLHDIPETDCALQLLGRNEGFMAVKYEIRSELHLASDKGSFAHLLVLDGEVTLKAFTRTGNMNLKASTHTTDSTLFHLQKGASVFIPADIYFVLSGNGTVLVVQGYGIRSALSRWHTESRKHNHTDK